MSRANRYKSWSYKKTTNWGM